MEDDGKLLLSIGKFKLDDMTPGVAGSRWWDRGGCGNDLGISPPSGGLLLLHRETSSDQAESQKNVPTPLGKTMFKWPQVVFCPNQHVFT